MAQNIFEELHQKKQDLISMVTKAKEFKWFDSDDAKNSKTADDLIAKINQDTLTIGVIGQMKCGKSTFLNAFVFEEDVLPAATTPMTAALSKITYGEQKKIVADFYSTNDWEEQKALASRSTDDASELEKSKIQAAQELVDKSRKLGGSLSQYLGKTQEDSFDNLVEYVGADGKFVSITKSVTIYYPKEYLKGVEIVDTPGFNDPIVSREERTKDFLVKADVVVMLLFAGRAFDATDRTILFENVRKCGIGKVLIGINKYDLAYEKGEKEDEIKDYVKKELRNASKECGDATLAEILKDTEPIPLSAEMALLSKIAEKDMPKITSNESYKFAWDRHCGTFEISNYKQFAEKSHIGDLIAAIKDMIEKEKAEIMFKKPLNAVKAAAAKRLEDLAKQVATTETSIKLYNTSDEDLDEKKEKISKAKSRLGKKIDGLEEEISSSGGGLTDIIDTGRQDLENAVDSACKQLNRIVDDWSKWDDVEVIRPQLDSTVNILNTRTLKRLMNKIVQEMKKKLHELVRDFFSEAGRVCGKYIPDVEMEDLAKEAQRKIEIDIENGDIFEPIDTSNSEEQSAFGAIIEGFLTGATFGLFDKLANRFSHNSFVTEIKSTINKVQNSYDFEPYLNSCLENGRARTIAAVKGVYTEGILTDLENQIDEIQSKMANKAKAIAEAKALLDKLKAESAEVKKHMAEMGIEK